MQFRNYRAGTDSWLHQVKLCPSDYHLSKGRTKFLMATYLRLIARRSGRLLTPDTDTDICQQGGNCSSQNRAITSVGGGTYVAKWGESSTIKCELFSSELKVINPTTCILLSLYVRPSYIKWLCIHSWNYWHYFSCVMIGHQNGFHLTIQSPVVTIYGPTFQTSAFCPHLWHRYDCYNKQLSLIFNISTINALNKIPENTNHKIQFMSVSTHKT